MRRLLTRIAPALRLTRVTMAFSVIANTWFVILWTRTTPREGYHTELNQSPLWLLLGAAAMVGIGLFSFGVALNDILDQRRDRILRPQRPIAAGQITTERAVLLVAGTMILAILGATAFGTQAVLWTLALLGAIIVFNAAGKFVPAVGLVFLGLIYGGHMLIPNLHLKFLWPVWWVMTHALLVAAATHAMARKVPKLSRRAVIAAFAGWLFWSGMLLWQQWKLSAPPGGARTLWPDWVPATAIIYPIALALLFIFVAARRVYRHGTGPRAAQKIERYGALWLSFYACAWLLGTGHTNSGLIMTAMAAAAVIGMTVLREGYSLLEQPLGYRR